jgi:hypothetical protein
VHEYLLHDLALATLAERRREAGSPHVHRVREARTAADRPGPVARLLAHLRLRPVDPPRRPEPGGVAVRMGPSAAVRHPSRAA